VSDRRKSVDFFGAPRNPAFSGDPRAISAREKTHARENRKKSERDSARRAAKIKIIYFRRTPFSRRENAGARGWK